MFCVENNISIKYNFYGFRDLFKRLSFADCQILVSLWLPQYHRVLVFAKMLKNKTDEVLTNDINQSFNTLHCTILQMLSHFRSVNLGKIMEN